MYSDYEIEEIHRLREELFGPHEQERYEYLVAWEAAQPGFRRRVAETLIALGARIDPSAARQRVTAATSGKLIASN